mmetsp:Transcript_15610/g.31242  ORF Transcript_15610/g.31242 Transcript_15610/m.31242 type:complete len:246 (-) Transcript_15610:264-1001(-)
MVGTKTSIILASWFCCGCNGVLIPHQRGARTLNIKGHGVPASVMAGLVMWYSGVSPALSVDECAKGDISPVIFRCAVSVKPGTEPLFDDNAALYLTARPDKPDNVPAAILSGTRGKAPPVLSARFPLKSGLTTSTFPYEIEVTEANLTPEGLEQSSPPSADSGAGRWWAGDNLIVSARLDSDGVAATRDPEDLVGRAIFRPKAQDGQNSKDSQSCGDDCSCRKQVLELQLQGRGVGGKLVTGKQK